MSGMIVNTILPTVPWMANTPYGIGASVTPQNVDDPAVPLPQYQHVALLAGTSGPTAPEWGSNAGVLVTDGTVIWLCNGIYLM